MLHAVVSGLLGSVMGLALCADPRWDHTTFFCICTVRIVRLVDLRFGDPCC